ncbi:uncharacterized protein ColSpa_07282 [Colletotrichum spaethianum]|uniref:Uncharacterized protein n=1 Tax=Colletotrichum spaethianum TaxID=700344 RepID=A0AA37LEZ7_9PEZI|nr:uncharacterized protein ColSpa_07282 [Colletotrichum spaethianum]GKT47101.1 hypothetical protein ColSpa_07282 [Colletotrichum spaethianum]
MSSANRKEQRVSFQTIPTSKSHRHQTSDSGVGSDFSSSPTAQEYFDLEKNHIKLKEEHLATRNKLKDAEAQLHEAHARLKAMQNTIDVLENDNKALDREKRNLRTEVEALHTLQPASGVGQDVGALPAHPPSPKEPKESKHSRRSESKHHRGESKHHRSESKPRKTTEDKELEKRVKQDKERLRGRFDHKDDKSVASSSSSGRSKQSGSYIEPLGPAASRPAVEPAGRPRHARTESTSYHDSIRPAVYTTVTEPAYSTLPRSPAYPEYDNDYYPDTTSQYVQEDGSYRFHPLPSPLPADPPRGRSYR